MPVPILIIGYGNPLRGDDGLGWQAAQRLEKTLPPELTHVITRHQLMPELADEISQAKLVFFIDAACEGKPGTLAFRIIEPAEFTLQAFSHEFDPAMLLSYAKNLYGHAPTAMLFTITGEQFACGEGLSSVVQQSLTKLLTLIQEKIKEYNLM